jgi:psiF repeat
MMHARKKLSGAEPLSRRPVPWSERGSTAPTQRHGRADKFEPVTEDSMRKFIVAAAIALLSTAAIAQAPAPKSDAKAPAKAAAPAAAPSTPSAMPGMTCKAQAADKKLAGAAMTSFMKKCQTEATKSCAQDGTTQNLKGAAKTSHMKKCVSDAVGT